MPQRGDRWMAYAASPRARSYGAFRCRAPATYGRGLEITLTCDDAAFEGQGVYLLASVLRHVFARQASLNSFTETVLCTLERNEVARWPAHLGNRPIL